MMMRAHLAGRSLAQALAKVERAEPQQRPQWPSLPLEAQVGGKYDKYANNGFPPNTCGGCGADDHYRNDCPLNPSRGKFPPREKGKGKGKGKNGKGKGGWAKGVDDEEYAEGEGEEEGDEQQADEGGSVLDDDADCTWAVSDEDEDDDNVYVITDARHFIPEATSEVESEESEELEEDAPESANVHILLESPFVEGREEIVTKRKSTPMYSSVLSSPPDRQGGTNLHKTPSAVDPWVSGSDPWKRGMSTEFADRFRKSSSPAVSAVSFADQDRASASPPTPTSAVALTRSLFESTVGELSPVVPHSDFVRPARTVSTNNSLSEAKRVRFLPPCACEFPPGFTEPAVTECATQLRRPMFLFSTLRRVSPSRVPSGSRVIVGTKLTANTKKSDI